MGEFEPVDDDKKRRPGTHQDWWEKMGAALFEHGPTLGAVGDWVANTLDTFENLPRSFRKADRGDAGVHYLHRDPHKSHLGTLPLLYREQCSAFTQRFDGDGPVVVSLSAFATSGHLSRVVTNRLNTNEIDTLNLSYHGEVHTVDQLMGRSLESELDEVRQAGYGAVKHLKAAGRIPYRIPPVGMGFSAGALKALAVVLDAVEAGKQLPFQSLILTSMPARLTNVPLGNALDGAYKAFEDARAAQNPRHDYMLWVDMAKVFAANPPWPKWLGTLDCAPLDSLISVRRMQRLNKEKIHLLPNDFPIHIVHSENDALCDLRGARAFFELIPSKKKEFFVVPGPHLPLVSEATASKSGSNTTSKDAQMHSHIANNLLIDCAIEMVTAS